MRPARILIAEVETQMSKIRAALVGFELVEVTTLQQAERMVMEDGIDLVVVGIHFDDSRAIQLINIVRSDSKHVATPVIVVRLCRSNHPGVLRHTMGYLLVNTISEYVEVDGDPELEEKIRAAVKKYLPADRQVRGDREDTSAYRLQTRPD